MLRLALVLYSLVGTSLAGSLVVAALTMGQDTLVPILIAAAVGFAAAVPIAIIVAKRLTQG